MLVNILYGILIGSFVLGMMSVGGLLVYEWMEKEIDNEHEAIKDALKKSNVHIDIIDER